MESTRGFEGPSKPLTRTLTTVGLQDPAMDPEVVPSSLSDIAAILRVANEIEDEAPRVAYLCRFHAFEKAHNADPNSTGRGVRQFKTALLSKLERDVDITHKIMRSTSDAKEMRFFYEKYYERYIKSLERPDSENVDRAQLARKYKTGKILFEVLKAVSHGEPDEAVAPELMKESETLAEREEIYGAYNILPLYPGSASQAIMMLPEIMAAVTAVRNVRGLPWPREFEISTEKSLDLLDWLQVMFGFQKHNVANQRENLILLLANAHIRGVRKAESQNKLDDDALDAVWKKLFQNYKRWCMFLVRPINLELPSIQREMQQRKILYMGLYLLIWGEAANLRFMPESLCYIFHHMASELHGMLAGNVSSCTGENTTPAYGGEENSFLKKVVRPIYNVIAEEVKCNKEGKARHSAWRNYDDLNEYFWSTDCFRLNWPMRLDADFFTTPDEKSKSGQRDLAQKQQPAWIGNTQHVEARSFWHGFGKFDRMWSFFQRYLIGKRRPTWIGKTQFVEVRSFLHIFRSFDRMWSFFILTFQAMIIVAWNGSGPITDVFHTSVLEKVLSIFITAAILRLIQAIVDIALSLKAWGSMKSTDVLRYILKVVVAAAWVIILPVCYAYTWSNPFGLFRTLKNWFGQSSRSQSLYITAVTAYLVPDGLGALIFLFPKLRRAIEQSDWQTVQFLLWWSQPHLYIGRGMHENQLALLKYTLFWVLVFISKFLFSYYVEVRPLVGPSKQIMYAPMENPYEWHELFPKAKDNWGVLVAVWTPIIMVYFMDTQIWYSIWSTIFGGMTGALRGLGEIRTLEMLKSRFNSLPGAFNLKLMPSSDKAPSRSFSFRRTYENVPLTEAPQFCQLWNEVISVLREEDYINNEEKEFLLMPDSSEKTMNLVQFPPFLLAGKIHIALDTAKDFTETTSDVELMERIKSDEYMIFAVKECYALFKVILNVIAVEDNEKNVINNLLKEVDQAIEEGMLTKKLKLSALPFLYHKFVELLEILEEGDNGKQGMVSRVLQDMYEVYTKDIRDSTELGKLELNIVDASSSGKDESLKDQYHQLFATNAICQLPPESNDIGWTEQIKRLRLLLRDSAMEVPTNLEARRRIAFFTNSLFMDIPFAPKVRNMLSFSVLTPYYNEEILYTREGLEKETEDGVSILYYLQKIYPDEWKNFLQRTDLSDENVWDNKDSGHKVREWASYRAQTLTRTVRGMMYYRRALELQAFSDMASKPEIQLGYEKAVQSSRTDIKHQRSLYANIQAVADMKFTYVATCQDYGRQKRMGEATDILELMKKYPALRVAYIDEVDKDNQKTYYSVLVKGIKDSDSDQEIYRIELPGKPILGEGKPENQNHAIIFTRGEALQAIDMNQDNYLEEAFKMRNLLQEFLEDDGLGFPAILGMREHIFTGSVSSLAGFMSNQESSFVTIGQRVLANPLKVRFHYGHPDVFDRLFHITRGGISKASRVVNLSEDIFAGFNTTLRRGNVTHHEYIQVGKGRDVGLNQISLFEAKIANGNGEQTMSRDIYRLGHRFDFFRMLSVYFTTVGFYFSTQIVVLTVYVFLYGRIYLALSGLEQSLVHLAGLQGSAPLQVALASQSFVQIGLLMALPMVIEMGLERGYRMALSEFIVMQLQLASVFFTFSMGTKVHFYGRTLLHGGAKYRGTGRGFVVFHAKFSENYRLYSRSHFTKGLELLILLVVYNLYGTTVTSTAVYFLVTLSLWFLVGTWLFAPFLFNPSGFEWQKIVDDWADWMKWVSNRGGIGVHPEKSWESWWEEEHAHLATTGLRGQLIEIILAARFLLYQYGLVYHLNITHRSKSILVYGLSWVVLVFILVILKFMSVGRGRLKFKAKYQIFFRLLKAVLLLSGVATLAVLFVVENLTVGDIFVSALAFIPSGWAILQIAQTCKPLVKKVHMWGSIKALARGYECIMGSLLFAPLATLAWFPFISDFQTRLLFNQAFSRGLQISRILAGRKEKKSN